MSVYIKGMEMPKGCNECRFFVDAWCYALEVDDWRNAYNKPQEGKRLDGCPLVPVPHHGRLIDADALMEIISKVIGINASIDQRNEATDQERRCLWWFEEQVNIAPTIIPADKEGE